MKRLLAVLFAAGAVAAATAGSRAVDARRDEAVRRASRQAASDAAARTLDALTAHVGTLKDQATTAAQHPRLVGALHGNVDAATLQDGFSTEDWWKENRQKFKVSALALDGDKLDVIEGMKIADFASELLVRNARERREPVAEIVVGGGWPYAAAAVAIPVAERPIAPVLVVARPIDEETMRKLADRARGAVLLSNGSKAVIEAGPDGERERLRMAVGQEKEKLKVGASTFEPPAAPGAAATDLAWAAFVNELPPSLWLWTYASGATAAAESVSDAAAKKGALWAAAAVLALVALFLGLRRPRLAPSGMTAELVTAGQLSTGGTAQGRATAAQGPGGTLPGAGGPVSASAATEIVQTDGGIAAASRATSSGAVQFGRYTLIDRLGEGGMAEVYTAATFGAEGFRRTFVVKRLRAELAREPSVVAQFIDEANLASTLVHSNIIPVFDFGKVGGEYFLAQEYILGRDLGRLTLRVVEKEAHALAPAVVLYAVSETLKALEYAHTKLGDAGRPLGIVHRDVSPSNILISARGEVKLFDFGIVKAEGRVTKTQHGVVKGNVSFMSPEQAKGTDIDSRADLFSLGLVAFYCLTGDVLYHGNTTYELLVKAATGPGPEELARIAALPGPCAEIFGKALQVDPARRYATAAEFGAAVAPHLAGGSAEAARLMRALFTEDFKKEEARFAAAFPTPDKGTDPGSSGPAGGPGTGGTQELGSRRS